jgi:hypothetical protein
MGWCGLDGSGSGQGQVESCNEFVGSVRCWKTVEWPTELVASRVVLTLIELVS